MRSGLMIAIALTIALFVLVPAFAIPKIEQGLASRAAILLGADQHSWATVRAEGVTLTIEGEAPTAAIRDSALQAVSAIAGVRAVEDATTLLPPRPFELTMIREVDRLRLQGEIPTAEAEAAILDAIAMVDPTLEVDSELTVVAGAPPEAWLEAAVSAAEQAARLFDGQATLSPDRFNITGTVLDQPTLDLIRGEFATNGIREATVDVSVLMPRLYPLSLVRQGDRLIISGEAPDEESRDALITLAERQGVLIVDAVGLTLERGVATENWHELTSALIRHVSAMQEAEARLEPGRLELSGTMADSAMADLVRTALGSVFEDVGGMELDIDIHAPETASDDASSIMADLADTQALLDYADVAEIPPVNEDQLLQAADCQSALNALVADDRVRFVGASADLDPASRHLLEAVALTMRHCAAVLIEVSGHTEAGGDGVSDAQKLLSTAMAESVVDYLRRRGVDEAMLVAAGYGDMVPIADNTTEEGRARNRRIEFLVAPEQ